MTFAISLIYISQSQHQIQSSQMYNAADKQVALGQGAHKQNDQIIRSYKCRQFNHLDENASLEKPTQVRGRLRRHSWNSAQTQQPNDR